MIVNSFFDTFSNINTETIKNKDIISLKYIDIYSDTLRLNINADLNSKSQ